MKKNNGFIATSLLYSFFLIFCAILLSLVGNFLHNRTLHNNTISKIKENLSNAGRLTLSNAEIGSYVKMPVFCSGLTINFKNTNWIVSSINSDKTITLVSDNIVMMSNSTKDPEELQLLVNHFYNMYTTGLTDKNYLTYFTKELIDDFEDIDDVFLKKALLSSNNEYFYYDESNNSFYLYRNSCNENDECEVIKDTDLTQYGLRLVMTVSIDTPVSSGIGVLNNPYEILYYTHENSLEKSLVLHYDNLNPSANNGFETTSDFIKDLSGTNLDGTLDTGTYTNDQTEGITIPLSSIINTNLNIYEVLNSLNGYTIEFRAKNYLTFESNPDYSTYFIILDNNTDLSIYWENNPTGLTTDSFNTISLVKKTGFDNLDIYINGEFLKHTFDLPTAINNVLYIGGSTNNDIFKSIRVYNTALTEAELMHNYNVDLRWNK
ncbi:MAG: hypothetical protein PHX04_01270 [Bacilli bacterium]|nr:hypothetical protein [Bacilli bacterium]